MADSYEVISHRQTWDQDPSGAFTQVMEWAIRTKPGGHTAKVVLPLDTSPAQADAAFASKAEQLEAIAGL